MKSKLPLGVIGVAIVTLFGYHRIHQWQQQQVRLIQQQIVEERDKQRAQADVATLLQQVEQYRTRLPHEANASWLVQEVLAIGKKAGVQLTTVSEEAPQKFQQFTRLGVNLQCKASFHQLGTFLDYLERSNHFIKTERMTVSAPGHDGVASVQVTVSTLYLPPFPVGSGT